MMSILSIALLFLTADVQVRTAGQSHAAAIPPGALTMAIESTGGRLCAPNRGTDVTEAALMLRFTNRSSTALRVRPDTSYAVHTQIVRTVEEFVPMGPDTDGVTWVMPPEAGAVAAPRLLAPGDSISVAHTLRILLRGRSGETTGLEPGHYFLELVGVLQAAPAGTESADAFRPVSVVSPYVEIEIGARAGPLGKC